MCGPDRVLFRPLSEKINKLKRFYQWPLFLFENWFRPWYFSLSLDIGHVFAKCLIFDEFFLWFTYRLSKQKAGAAPG